MNIRPNHVVLALACVFAGAACAKPQPTDPTVTYTVQPGDKLIDLAHKILAQPARWTEVAKLNKMAQPNTLVVGQTIKIPLRLMRWAPGAARLVSANGDIQVNGLPAVAGAAIGEGDKVQAGAASSAVIALEDGSRIQLMPQSLAELVNHRGYGQKAADGKTNWFAAFLRLTQGAIEAVVKPGVQRASPFEIKTPTSVVGVRGTHFRVAIDGQARSEVIEGRVVAENPAQLAKAELSTGTGAVIRPDEKRIEVKQLLAAPDLQGLPAQLHSNASWNWPAAPGAKAWRVQLATDAQFSHIVFEDKLAVPSWAMANLPLGQWHARVRAIDNVGLEGFDAARSLEIVAAVVPQWRLKTSTLTLRNGMTALTWTPTELPGNTGGEWRATVLNNGVAVPSRSVYSGAGSLTEYLELPPGAYTLQVQGTNAQGTPFPPKTFRLQVPGGWGSSTTTLANPLQPID